MRCAVLFVHGPALLDAQMAVCGRRSTLAAPQVALGALPSRHGKLQLSKRLLFQCHNPAHATSIELPCSGGAAVVETEGPKAAQPEK